MARRKKITPEILKKNLLAGPNVVNKMLFRVNDRTQVYVDKNSTPEQLEAIKEKHNNIQNRMSILIKKH